jgi:hypothetical protein
LSFAAGLAEEALMRSLKVVRLLGLVAAAAVVQRDKQREAIVVNLTIERASVGCFLAYARSCGSAYDGVIEAPVRWCKFFKRTLLLLSSSAAAEALESSIDEENKPPEEDLVAAAAVTSSLAAPSSSFNLLHSSIVLESSFAIAYVNTGVQGRYKSLIPTKFIANEEKPTLSILWETPTLRNRWIVLFRTASTESHIFVAFPCPVDELMTSKVMREDVFGTGVRRGVLLLLLLLFLSSSLWK